MLAEIHIVVIVIIMSLFVLIDGRRHYSRLHKVGGDIVFSYIGSAVSTTHQGCRTIVDLLWIICINV